jgi:DNA-binding FrmR family transcriptional regulator
MRNRDVALTKLDRIEGKLKTIDVMLSRPNTTGNDIREMLSNIQENVDDVRSMIEREQVNYGK